MPAAVWLATLTVTESVQTAARGDPGMLSGVSLPPPNGSTEKPPLGAAGAAGQRSGRAARRPPSGESWAPTRVEVFTSRWVSSNLPFSASASLQRPQAVVLGAVVDHQRRAVGRDAEVVEVAREQGVLAGRQPAGRGVDPDADDGFDAHAGAGEPKRVTA